MKPVISIKFDENVHGVFYSGQLVSGKVEITFSDTKKVRGILLDVSGIASARFTGRSNVVSRRKRRRKVRYSGKEQYVSSQQYLYGSESATPTEIQPGKYTYDFSLPLPLSVPSSFEGHYGHIRYVAKVVLDRPWKFDQKFMHGFTVLKSLDLNHESPSIRAPATHETSKAFMGGIFKITPLTLRVSIPQTGYAPGQQIPIRAEIENASSLPVAKIRFYLKQIISYYAETPHSNSKTDMIRVSRLKTVLPAMASSPIKIEQKLGVPPLPPTCVEFSKIIRISYELTTELAAFGWHPKPTVNIPIIIGTVPLIATVQPLAQTTGPMQQPMCMPPGVANPMPSTSFSTIVEFPEAVANLSPPSYEEAVTMQRAQIDAGEENSIQRSEFLPRYPVYSTTPLIPITTTSPPEVEAPPLREKEKIIPI